MSNEQNTNPPSNITQNVTRLVRNIANKPEGMSVKDIEGLYRLLAKWRHILISNTQITLHGNQVQSGPFAGLKFVGQPSEGCTAPRILGCYEHELHPFVEHMITQPFDAILNIGCADGYYAVGLAQRMPNTQVFAHDLNPVAQDSCRKVAELNGISSEQITIGGLFEGKDFARFAGKKTWLIMDIEGGEQNLLDPAAYPELKNMTILVESHDCYIPQMTETLTARFANSHHITRINNQLTNMQLPEWLQKLGHLDQLTAVWEWRMGPTPWLVMEPK